MSAINSVLPLSLAVASSISAYAAPDVPVTLTEPGTAYTLANGIVTAEINKRTGDLVSLKYRGLEFLGSGSGHAYGYWSHSPGSGMRETDSITIDPAKNGGERGEVSVKGFYTDGSSRFSSGTACDIEIRYALARGDSGLYTYSIFTHETNYPATGIGEARFCAKLNPRVFDYMTIDARRNKLMPKPEDWDLGTQLNLKEARRLNTGIYKGQVEHKYDYSAIQFDIPAYGWSSTKHHVGIWFINPSMEYLSGGPTKVELTGHLDNNEGALPTLLNYWRGSHYGGSICAIGPGEKWSKVIGPFLIYCNAGPDPDRMWKDALGRAGEEAKAWPYDWVEGVDYPHKRERGTVEGRIVVNDPRATDLVFSNMLVGLAAPDYTTPRFNRGEEGLGFPSRGEDGVDNGVRRRNTRREYDDTPRTVDWQNDARNYEFWVRADSRGRFSIPKVSPGTYTLHAIADGILGEAVLTNIVVQPGRKLDLGSLKWKPSRFGRQLWEIGVPDRSAGEFRHGDQYWQWGLYNEYAKEFPHDVDFFIGKSDYHKDWNYAQLPHSLSEGSAWAIHFNLSNVPPGKATLRIGIAGASLRGGIEITVNGRTAGSTGPLPDTATIRRDGIRGYWSERDVTFPASLLKPGSNVLKLIIPPGSPASGVEYDYLRLELEEALPVAASGR